MDIDINSSYSIPSTLIYCECHTVVNVIILLKARSSCTPGKAYREIHYSLKRPLPLSVDIFPCTSWKCVTEFLLPVTGIDSV